MVPLTRPLVAEHGAELMQIAREHRVNYLYEASCGGGIPIIRPLCTSLTADEIDEISGILNGTTNYILTKMAADGTDFASALKEAQDRGYAERNPEADVEGYDACRKIAILSSLAFGSQVNYQDIYTEGITKITAEDIKYAQAIGVSIKLLATSRKVEGGVYAMVSPVMIGTDNPLYSVLRRVQRHSGSRKYAGGRHVLRTGSRQASHRQRGGCRCGGLRDASG